MKNKIFAFWESSNGTMPAYLELCKLTWIINIPNIEIHIINYSNLDQYIDGVYDLELLKKIPLAMQSDIISAAVLEKFGGLFLDIDCIITEDIFLFFKDLPKNKLIGFGREGKGIHLAVLYANQPNNIILTKWREAAQEKLNNLIEDYGWDYFGNSILDPLIEDKEFKDSFLIIDRTESGNILESKLMIDSNLRNAKDYYKNFYFNRNFSINENVLSNVGFGIISLHNSWTPIEFKNESDIKKFLKKDIPLNTIFKKILLGQNWLDSNNTFFLKIWFKEEIKQRKLDFSFRVLNEILVIDLWVDNVNFAFDVYSENSAITVDFLVRENEVELNKMKEYTKYYFKKNKARLGVFHNKESALVSILETTNLIKRFYN